MDAQTRRNLEIETSLGARDEYTLAGLVDRCATAMGSRLLRRWLNRPIRDRAELKRRQQAVDLLQRRGPLEDTRFMLKEIGDLERVLTRVALRSARPRDLAQLRDGLERLPELRKHFAPCPAERVQALVAKCGAHDDERDLLRRALVETPPVLLRDGGVIAPGYDAELDELRHDQHECRPVSRAARAARARANRHRGTQGRLQPRARLLHRDDEGAVGERRPPTTSAARRSKAPSATSPPSSRSSRTRCLSRARARARRARKRSTTGCSRRSASRLAALQQTAESIAELDTLANLAERVNALDLVMPELVDEPRARVPRRPASRRRALERRAVRAERFGARASATRMLIITGPEHGRQVDLHAPDRADRDPRAHRQLRAGASPRRHRTHRPDLHAHRRGRRSHRRPLDVHGRDDGDREHPEQRDALEPRADGRGRPRHEHVRRPVARVGRGAPHRAAESARSRCSRRTTSS